MPNEIELKDLLGHSESVIQLTEETVAHEKTDGFADSRYRRKSLTRTNLHFALFGLIIFLGIIFLLINKISLSHGVFKQNEKHDDEISPYDGRKPLKAKKAKKEKSKTTNRDCVDDPNFQLENFPEKTCDWITEENKNSRLCDQHYDPKSLVRDACPVACGVCFTQYKKGTEQQDSKETNHGNSDYQMTIVEGIDDKDVYCEDLTQYEKWHEIKITKNDGIMYQVVKQMDHDKESFTQGLTYARGKLFESAGLYGKSSVRILDRDSSQVERKVSMGPKLFAEGITYYKDTLVQITWKSRRGFIYNVTNLEEIDRFNFMTTVNEGWGITWDRCNDELIVTDGSPNLHFWDPRTMTEIRRVKVTRMDGTDAKEMNEIEYWRGRVLANIWYEDVVLVINPETGVVEKEYDFSQLWPKSDRRKHGADVLNGISISEYPNILYFTGKRWNRMYELRLLPEL